MCGNRSACLGVNRMCSVRVGPGTEGGARASKAWAKEEARQCCAVTAGVTLCGREGTLGAVGRPQAAMPSTPELERAQEGQESRLETQRKGLMGGVRSCGHEKKWDKGARPQTVCMARPACGCRCLQVVDMQGLLAAHLSTWYEVGLSSAQSKRKEVALEEGCRVSLPVDRRRRGGRLKRPEFPLAPDGDCAGG